jgi:hypothetical protein
MRRACALLLALSAGCGDGNACDTGPSDVGDVCLPPLIAPGIPITLEVRELCGRGCTAAPTCSAVLRDGRVALEVEQEVCADTVTASCLSAPCQERAITCKLPALTAGVWALAIDGAPSRLLRVGDGGVATCRFQLAPQVR